MRDLDRVGDDRLSTSLIGELKGQLIAFGSRRRPGLLCRFEPADFLVKSSKAGASLRVRAACLVDTLPESEPCLSIFTND